MKKVLNICEKYGFFKSLGPGLQADYSQLGPAGDFFCNNIRQEWILSNIISREENIFPFHNKTGNCTLDWSGQFYSTPCEDFSHNSMKEPFLHAKNLSCGHLPFGLAHIQSCQNVENEDKSNINTSTPEHQWKTLLRSLLFVSPNDARQCFYTWQQSRKMWWRKFSAYPGRFSLSDIKEKNVENSSIDQRVNILAKFDWGISPVEMVQVYSCSSMDLSSEYLEDFKAKDGRKLVSPCVVESVVSLEDAALVFLCDAYSETSSARKLLRLHRRLAPFKVGFVASLNASDSSESDKIQDLAQHLSMLLRRSGLTTLLLPDLVKKSEYSQLARNDGMGVPFTVVLGESSLSDGIVHLYSRETTLKEQVHISQLTKYIELLVKNY